MRFLFSYLYVGSLLTLAAMVFFALGFGWPMLQDYIDQLPGIEIVNDYRPDLGSQMFDADGNMIAEFYKELKRQRVARYEDLPPHLIQALIATEDQRFYEHNGVNPFRILTAFYTNFTKGTRQGGSTITQQIAKALFVGAEKTYERKIKEALYAMKIEQELSKEEIITIYFNQSGFGHNKAGIWAAAEEYFGKTPKELNLAESATLVGLLKANTTYSPLINYKRSKERRGVVLDSMLECKFITQEERDKAAEEDLVLKQKSADRPPTVNRFPYWRAYFEDVLFRARKVQGGLPLTNDRIENLTEDQIYRGGLKINTTLDPKLQDLALAELQKALIDVEKIRRKQPPGWGLSEENRPKFASRVTPNATLLGVITGVVDKKWLTVRLIDTKSNSIVAVRYPQEDDWRVRFGVLLPNFYVEIKAVERPTVGDGSPVISEQELIDRGLVSKQACQFELISTKQDMHAQGAMVCLENGSGKILAWAGGFDWSEETPGRQRIRCIDGQQPGSAFKPLIFAEAFGKGYTPSTYVSNEAYYKVLPNGDVWKPRNYDKERIGGRFQIRDVLVRSLNIPTVRVFESIIGGAYEYDPGTFQQTLGIARRLGIRSPIPKELSVSLGTADVTPLEMATAYSVFANGGVLVEPYAIESIETRNSGQKIYLHLPAGDPNALDHVTSFVITDILKDVLRKRGGTGYSRAHDFPYPIAGKTGTTNNYNDAWFVGYSKTLTTAVWIGHDRRTSLGGAMSAGKVALPPWLSFMKEAIPYHLKHNKGWSDADIKAASGNAVSPNHVLAFDTPGKGVKRVEVCSYSLKRPNALCKPTIWIWVKEGQEPREVCSDCRYVYKTVPSAMPTPIPGEEDVIPEMSEEASEGIVQPRPVQSKRLQPIPPPGAPPPAPISSDPQVDIHGNERGWVPDEAEWPEHQPSVPRPFVPVERRRL
ncbi:transglycosylase domain-containing protein [bacterium]|nr:transglycosylase domain-containing protein [bacterium]NUP94090.1 transglycosylase domain-containing protein [Candidatus Omnitrophota bacterium]